MAEITTLSQLNNKILELVKDSMQEDVTRTVQAIQRQEIKRKVYGAYTPVYYERRYQDGGLLSKDNIKGYVDNKTNGTRLTVANETKFNRRFKTYRWTYNSDGSEFLTPLIVMGHDKHESNGGSGYWAKNVLDGGYSEPRDFISSTREVLQTSGSHTKSLKKSLTRKGLDVK